MPDDPNTTPPPDDGPAPDPVEAELVAYLDGELDPPAARRVAARLAADPALRRRADALKRSFALLDFLPKSEPSATFASRTLDKLPTVKSAPHAAPVAAVAESIPPASASVPVVLASTTGLPPAGSSRHWAWAFGLFAAVGAALGSGYFGTAAARAYLFPAAPPTPKEPTADDLPLADLRAVENLPLYAGVDDLDFLDQLAAPEFFAGDGASPPDGPAAPPAGDADKPSGKALDALVRAFRALPADRRDAVRRLDQQLHDLDPPRRDRLFRVLEAYAAWLHRLPPADRAATFAAPTAAKRLEVIRDVQRAQWVAALPAAQRNKLKDLPAADRADLIARWKLDEEQRREAWVTARAHWDAVRTGRQPWPFADDRMKAEVLAFARAAYHPDDPRRCRLSTVPNGGDLARLREAIERAEKAGEWVWLGKTVYDFSRTPKYDTLPEPAAGKPVTEFADLWASARAHYENRPNARRKIEPHAGKWPDFALAVWEDAGKPKQLAVPPSFRLGPARPDELKPEVKRFLPEMKAKATPAEWDALAKLEGKWPEYPRELVKLAKAHDLGVPGVTPPGPPSRWDQMYNAPRPPVPRPGG